MSVSRLVFFCLGLPVIASTWTGSMAQAETPVRSDQPNVILINLDDADSELLSPETLRRLFPNLKRFSTEGIRFTNFHVTTPLCGPSRACLLRGQYAHNTGIRTNDPFSDRSNGFGGGMRQYRDRGYFENDLSTWMQAAGYRTMMVGKFLHGDTLNVVPPGWDDFYSSRGAEYFGTFRFTNRDNPDGEMLREDVTTYRTRVESQEVIDLIQRHVNRKNSQPFFLYFNPLTPHNESPASRLGMVEERYQNEWPDMRIGLSADFNEKNLTDKSTAMQQVPPLNEHWLDYASQRNRYRHLAMLTIDDMVAALLYTLDELNLRDNTYVLLTSDNGFCNGHHRLFGKSDPFHRSTNVPLYVLGPGIRGGASAGHLLAHIDLAPTIVDLAGASPPALVDGRSFRPLLNKPRSVPENQWRDAILIENWERRMVRGRDYNFGSFALRMFDRIYVEWAAGSPEFYDLATDPLQLRNKYNHLPAEQREFLKRYLRMFRETSLHPQTTISEPLLPGDVLKKRAPLTGMAEDDRGIRNVELVIRRMSDFFCWNGQSWQPGLTTVEAAVANPGQQLTGWSYEAPSDIGGDEYLEVRARAYNLSGNGDVRASWGVFRYDFSKPRSTMTVVGDGTNPPLLQIEGTVHDERKVTGVQLVIRDAVNNRYWTGTRWVDNWTYLMLPVSRRTQTWSWSNPQVVGSLYLSCRAVDDSGNVQSPPTTLKIRIQPEPPAPARQADSEN